MDGIIPRQQETVARIIGLSGPGDGIRGVATATALVLVVSKGGEILVETGGDDFMYDLFAGRNPVSDFLWNSVELIVNRL